MQDSILTPRRLALLLGAGIGIVFLRRYLRIFMHSKRGLKTLRFAAPEVEAEICSMASTSGAASVSSFIQDIDTEEAQLHRALDSIRNSLGNLLKVLDVLKTYSPICDGEKRSHGHRQELLGSAVVRLRILETDIASIAAGQMLSSSATNNVPPRSVSMKSRALSVLSDDSFMSALDEILPPNIEELEPRYDYDAKLLFLLEEGKKAVAAGDVIVRNVRLEATNCVDEIEFLAKVYCLRKAFNIISTNEHKRVFLVTSGRQLLADMLKKCGQNPDAFYKTFDNMLAYLRNAENHAEMAAELSDRRVPEINFWDVLIDFILLDVLDDLQTPPSAIYAVTCNSWISDSLKLSTISTVVWSLLKTKRQRLKIPRGFIGHFYDISEVLSPSLALGFLGSNDVPKEICYSFRDNVLQFISEIFDEHRVRYTDVNSLAEDVWIALQSRVDTLTARASNELLEVDLGV